MQSKDDLEKFYEQEDPWKFRTTLDDLKRRDQIVMAAAKFSPYNKALDIGAGEGFVTSCLPAKEIWGYEISDLAASRFPSNVKRCHFPDGYYDLIVATGVFYPQYDFLEILKMVENHCKGIFVTSNIKEMEVPELERYFYGNQIYQEEFRYRQYTQRLRIYKLGQEIK